MGKKPSNEHLHEEDVKWDDAIRRVLTDADGALHYTEIAERIVSEGLRQAVGATPANTVAVYLSNSLKEANSPYIRTGRGEYALRERVEKHEESNTSEIQPDEQVIENWPFNSFGILWRRDFVNWNGKTALFGIQGIGATTVDFSNQIGVYLLHDRERVIYVGRAFDTLLSRLKEHTRDRLAGRWDRFSWFGLRAVDATGRLIEKNLPNSEKIIIEAIEALLIEVLEPSLNRRRGDNIAAYEYIQAPDPEIEAENFKVKVMKMIMKDSPSQAPT